MGEAADAGWEDFGGYDEGGGVGTEIEEELEEKVSLLVIQGRHEGAMT